MDSVGQFLNQRLKLKLNREKSRVARPSSCNYLGYGMLAPTAEAEGGEHEACILRGRVGELLCRVLGRKMANVIERINLGGAD